MGGSKTLADVLRGLIADVPTYGWLIVVLSAVLGMFLSGYAMLRLYQANQSGHGTALNWIVAAIIGSALTCVTVIVASFSHYFAD